MAHETYYEITLTEFNIVQFLKVSRYDLFQ